MFRVLRAARSHKVIPKFQPAVHQGTPATEVVTAFFSLRPLQLYDRALSAESVVRYTTLLFLLHDATLLYGSAVHLSFHSSLCLWQSTDVSSNSFIACLPHYCTFSSTKAWRDYDSDILNGNVKCICVGKFRDFSPVLFVIACFFSFFAWTNSNVDSW